MFKNIWRWIRAMFQDLAEALEKPAEIAIEVVNVIKAYVYNPVVDIFTQMSRTGIDDSIVSLLKVYLPGIITALLKGENIISDVAKGDFSSILRLFVEHLTRISGDARGKWWTDLAALLVTLISGKVIAKPVAISVTQAIYLKKVA